MKPRTVHQGKEIRYQLEMPKKEGKELLKELIDLMEKLEVEG